MKEETVPVFFDLCLKRFRFLVDFFHCKKRLKNKRDAYQVIYQNKTTAIVVCFDWREQYIFVDIFKVVNNKIPDTPIIITPRSKLNGFDLEDILSIRNPDLKINYAEVSRPLTINDISRILDNYSLSIRQYASDLLQGDFSIFPELDKIVKDRI